MDNCWPFNTHKHPIDRFNTILRCIRQVRLHMRFVKLDGVGAASFNALITA